MVFFNRKKKNVFICPMGGNLMELEQVPDPVFAQKLMEEGFAVELASGEIFAPISGTVEALIPLKEQKVCLVKGIPFFVKGYS